MAYQNVFSGVLAFFFVFCVVRASATAASKPNIILIVADDLGWNDVSFHGSNQIPTPNIDALAYNGIILNSHYVPALCTPSRASLLTGKYPTSMGMQHLVILAPEPWGLPLEEVLMPEYFKRHGYATHAVGKWHLGFHQKEYTPTYRGFDTHFGYWNGYQDYFDHTMEDHTLEGAPRPLKGYDMRRGLKADYSAQGEYSTDAFTNEAVTIIKGHNSKEGPLFLYLAHLSPHSGNPDNPFQAPDDEIAKHAHIEDPERRVYAAMVTRLDEGVGKVVAALREASMLDNSIIVFMSDNGAVTFGVHSNRGSNYPLRGLKESPWEGGVRGVTAIWSPLLNQTRRVSNQLMHVSDWLPTLYSAAGLNVTELGQIDGINLWDSLSKNNDSPRTEVFNNYDEIENYSSLRVGPWKYIEGTAQGGEVDQWYGESGKDAADFGYDVNSVLGSKAGTALTEYYRDEHSRNNATLTPGDIIRLREEAIIRCPLLDDQHQNQTTSTDKADELNELKMRIFRQFEEIKYKYFENETISYDEFDQLTKMTDISDVFGCNPLKEICVFHLEADPCERMNLAKLLPGLVRSLQDRLRELKELVVKPANVPGDPFCDPALHNGTWSNWRDSDLFPSPPEYEWMAKEFLESVLNRDLLFILFNNMILKIVFSPILFLFNELVQLFIQNGKAYAVSFVILLVLFVTMYNIVKKFISFDDDAKNYKVFSVPLPLIKRPTGRFIKK